LLGSVREQESVPTQRSTILSLQSIADRVPASAAAAQGSPTQQVRRSRVQLKAAVRTMSYDDQLAVLTPHDGVQGRSDSASSPRSELADTPQSERAVGGGRATEQVQLKETNAPATADAPSDVSPVSQAPALEPIAPERAGAQVADGGGVRSSDDWERVAPQAQAERADGPLDEKALQKALKKLQEMSPRLDPAWVEACQRALGVPPTGGFTRAFLQAVATFERDRMGRKKKLKGLPDKAVRQALADAHAELQEVEEHFKAPEAERSSKAADKVPAWLSSGVVASGLAKNWDEFAGQFRKTELCGQTVHGHKLMIERIQVAEQYLERKFQLKGSALGEAVGCTAVADLRAPEKPGYHPTGFALDVNAADNPWIFGQDGRDEANARTKDVIARAVCFMGYGHELDLKKLEKLSQTMTTDEMYDHLQASNVALRNYRLLAGDDQAIEAQWQLAPDEAKQQGDAAWWSQRITQDDALLAYQGKDERKKSNWDAESSTNKGFMTMRQELVVALRDVGGLIWGGCDMGGDSGDMMHFDARTISEAKKLVSAAKEAKG
jgi:hypothetical protein